MRITLGLFLARYLGAAATVVPMNADLDIWRAANLLVKRHGDDAAIVAARRADELLAEGDLDGCGIWKRIVAAVNELARTKLAEGERVN